MYADPTMSRFISQYLVIILVFFNFLNQFRIKKKFYFPYFNFKFKQNNSQITFSTNMPNAYINTEHT